MQQKQEQPFHLGIVFSKNESACKWLALMQAGQMTADWLYEKAVLELKLDPFLVLKMSSFLFMKSKNNKKLDSHSEIPEF